MKSEIIVDTREAMNMQLKRAILVYESGHSPYDPGLRVHATLHEVAHFENRAPALLPGVTADKPAIAGLLASLGESLSFTGFIPHRLLFVGPAMLIWWTEPGMREVWFKADPKKLGERSGTTPHPGLVFAVSHGKWFVWAVAGVGRPGPETMLHQAPYFNVWQSGQICTGNVDLPRSFGIETIEGYENAFFGSYFTHPNIHEKGKLTKHRGGAHGLWKALLDGKHKAFPEETLVPATQPKTLGELPEYLNNLRLR